MSRTHKWNANHRALIWYCAVAALPLLAGCGREDAGGVSLPAAATEVVPTAPARAAGAALRVGGSTTMGPIIKQVARDFTARYGTWDRAKAGLPHEPIAIEVTGGGSAAGIKMAATQSVEIGLCSRALKDKDRAVLGKHVSFLVGRDCVAIAAAKSSPLTGVKTSFTTAELGKFFAGDYRTFRQLDPALPAEECILYIRTPEAGSSEIMRDRVMAGRPFPPAAVAFANQAELVANLGEQPRAVAFLSYVQVRNSERFTTFAVDGVAPSKSAIASGRYGLWRPLLMIVRGEPSAKAACFIEYVLREGQAAVAAQGCIPVREIE